MAEPLRHDDTHAGRPQSRIAEAEQTVNRVELPERVDMTDQ